MLLADHVRPSKYIKMGHSNHEQGFFCHMANAIAKAVVLAGDMIYKEREIDCKLTKSGVN